MNKEELNLVSSILSRGEVSKELQSAMADWFREAARYNMYLADRKLKELEELNKLKELDKEGVPW